MASGPWLRVQGGVVWFGPVLHTRFYPSTLRRSGEVCGSWKVEDRGGRGRNRCGEGVSGGLFFGVFSF